MTTVLAVYMTP